jgi:hypothetical protein
MHQKRAGRKEIRPLFVLSPQSPQQSSCYSSQDFRLMLTFRPKVPFISENLHLERGIVSSGPRLKCKNSESRARHRGATLVYKQAALVCALINSWCSCNVDTTQKSAAAGAVCLPLLRLICYHHRRRYCSSVQFEPLQASPSGNSTLSFRLMSSSLLSLLFFFAFSAEEVSFARPIQRANPSLLPAATQPLAAGINELSLRAAPARLLPS